MQNQLLRGIIRADAAKCNATATHPEHRRKASQAIRESSFTVLHGQKVSLLHPGFQLRWPFRHLGVLFSESDTMRTVGVDTQPGLHAGLLARRGEQFTILNGHHRVVFRVEQESGRRVPGDLLVIAQALNELVVGVLAQEDSESRRGRRAFQA